MYNTYTFDLQTRQLQHFEIWANETFTIADRDTLYTNLNIKKITLSNYNDRRLWDGHRNNKSIEILLQCIDIVHFVNFRYNCGRK